MNEDAQWIIDEMTRIMDLSSGATLGPWWHDEDDAVWRLFGGAAASGGHGLQLIKAPKKSKEYAPYWPNEADTAFILEARTMVPVMARCVRTMAATLNLEATKLGSEDARIRLRMMRRMLERREA